MDAYKHSAVERLEIVETGRRRRWSEDEKLRIVMESLSAPRLVSATARRHGISRWQLSTWRREFRAGHTAMQSEPAFVPAVIVPSPGAMTEPASGTVIMVELPTGSRVRLAVSTPAALAAAVLGALR